jgi:hypothetical protein
MNAFLNYNELIQIYFERSNALQAYWTLYVIVIVAALGFSSQRKQRDLVTTALVTVLFGVFAYQNLGGIRDTTAQRLVIWQAAAQFSVVDQSPLKPFGATLTPPAYEASRNFHLVGDVLAIAALWAMEARRRRYNPDNPYAPA